MRAERYDLAVKAVISALSLLTILSVHACGARTAMTLLPDDGSNLSAAPNPDGVNLAGGASSLAGGANNLAGGASSLAAGATSSIGNQNTGSCEDRDARCPVGTICLSGRCVLKPMCNAGPSRNGPSFVTTGASPSSIIIGDWNGDGFADFATANQRDWNVSVVLGCGDGSFASHVDYRVGRGPNLIATCDLNGDRKPDIVSAELNYAAVATLLNQGDGSFSAKGSYGVSGQGGPRAVTCADLNGDHFADVAVASGQGGLSVLLGQGDGSLGPARDYTSGGFVNALAIGDLNGDG
jgi:hypothetical protein